MEHEQQARTARPHTARRTGRRWRSWRGLAGIVAAVLATQALGIGASGASPSDERRPARSEEQVWPPAPRPEPIEVGWLPLPPTAPTADGSVIPEGCAHPTGCMSPADTGIMEGPSYMADGEHVVLPVELAGAPAGSPYTGEQVIAIKVDPGATFRNGDGWKCLTCGIPAANQVGRNTALDHPQPFRDGKRVLVGMNVLDCGRHAVTSEIGRAHV